PAKPSEIQPSAWHAHPSIRKVVIFLWVMVAACAGWAALVMCIWNKYMRLGIAPLTSQTWTLSPYNLSNYIWYIMPVVQGPLTLVLHCSELIANVVRDERQWRCATGRKGLRTSTTTVKTLITHPICLVLFVTKPFLHWMFGLAFNISEQAFRGEVTIYGVFMYTAQIWNFCITLFMFACLFTYVALRRPRGPQPAAYGHLQTLANLVDEWSPVMWWGHKEDGIPYCHAGRILICPQRCCVDIFTKGRAITHCQM
ncbi:hypothetical protein BDR03DRAFT_861751, partial [Suillus americanus]